MGKAAKLKQIRKIARELPVMHRKAVIGSIVSAQELRDKGVNNVANVPVMNGFEYKEKKVVSVPVNHNRQLKDAYKKIGLIGVAAYANAVIDRSKALAKA